MKKIALTLALGILFSYCAKAQEDDPKAVPYLISYQGCLKNNSGAYLNGNYSMTFSIWSASSGGNLLWTETQTAVKCTLGLFNVNLGSVVTIPISIFSASTDRYLQLKLNVSPAESLLPRTRLTSAGYAYISTVSDSTRGLQGRPVSNTAPSNGQVLKWNGSSWAPDIDNTGGTPTYVDSAGGARRVGGRTPGNSSGNIPINNGTLSSNLNADMVDGFHASSTPTANSLLPLDGYGRFAISGSNSPLIIASSSGLYSGSFITSVSNGIGLHGSAGNSGIGVYGQAGSYGVYGSGGSSSGWGVYGTGYRGVYGEGSSYGVVGISTSATAGVYGSSTGLGVYGYATSTSGNRTGGSFSANSGGWAYVGAQLSGTNYKIYGSGNVSTVMPTKSQHRVLFASEMPEPFFEDLGHGVLKAGYARIELDPLFVDCIRVDKERPLKVFVQLNDDCNGVYVKTYGSYFEVYELNNGKSNASFTYRVVANTNRQGDNVRFPLAVLPSPIESSDARLEVAPQKVRFPAAELATPTE
jgi:hypothetical protein